MCAHGVSYWNPDCQPEELVSTFASPEAKVEALRKSMTAGVGHSTNRLAMSHSDLLCCANYHKSNLALDRYLLESFSPFILFSKNERMHAAHPKHRVALRVDKVAHAFGPYDSNLCRQTFCYSVPSATNRLYRGMVQLYSPLSAFRELT